MRAQGFHCAAFPLLYGPPDAQASPVALSPFVTTASGSRRRQAPFLAASILSLRMALWAFWLRGAGGKLSQSALGALLRLVALMKDICRSTASSFLEAVWVESRRRGDVLRLGIATCFGLGGRNVADGLEQASVVEPVHPFQGGEAWNWRFTWSAGSHGSVAEPLPPQRGTAPHGRRSWSEPPCPASFPSGPSGASGVPPCGAPSPGPPTAPAARSSVPHRPDSHPRPAGMAPLSSALLRERAGALAGSAQPGGRRGAPRSSRGPMKAIIS